MNVLDLFSGIGGFSLGLERAGMKTVAFCEIEPYPQAVLRKNFPGVPIYDDVRTVTADRLRADGINTVDLICGGFPCQPFSNAGKQLGKEDHRHLWPEMLRIVQEFRPTWVIGENVAGFINMALEQVCIDLESAGYEVQPVVIPACAVDAPHRRDRVWILANSNQNGCQDLPIQLRRQKQTDFKPNRDGAVDANPKIVGRDETQAQNPFANRPQLQGEVGGLSCYAGGFTWLPEPSVSRVVDVLSTGMDDAIGAIGNSILPLIPEIIGRAIMQIEGRPHATNQARAPHLRPGPNNATRGGSHSGADSDASLENQEPHLQARAE